MEEQNNSAYPIIFLGISEHIKNYGLLPSVTPIDIFKLKRQSTHIIYPISLNAFNWIFLINTHFLIKNSGKLINIEVKSEKNEMKVQFKMQLGEQSNKEFQSLPKETLNTKTIALPKSPTWYIQPLALHGIEASLDLPGTYNVYAGIEEANTLIGQIDFLYQKVPLFTADQIKAIESNPLASKKVLIEIGCKECPTKLKVYSSLKRDQKVEDEEGYLWQDNLPEEFICSCRKTKQNLVYLKESMHGLLGKDQYLFDSKISYERRNSHGEILRILNEFNNLLDKKNDEVFFQQFIEKNPIMLAKYCAKKIFFKKDLLGEFEADIIIFNTENQLIFIELESAGIQLFKKDGHPTAKLMHAHNQIIDWLEKYRKHPHAFLEVLGLRPDDISLIKGVVIAGRNRDVSQAHLRRCCANPIYRDIDFLTYDFLADNLAQISRDLI